MESFSAHYCEMCQEAITGDRIKDHVLTPSHRQRMFSYSKEFGYDQVLPYFIEFRDALGKIPIRDREYKEELPVRYFTIGEWHRLQRNR